MTRQEYVAIADTFRQSLEYYLRHEDVGKARAVRVLASLLADRLKQEHHGFDRVLFLMNCGIPEAAKRIPETAKEQRP